ncbi:DUF2857 domain-containing protein [Cedecea sp. NFIX57]|jgi:hypothetical protein|uniref:DUF2857 domain-containing protein n=1 Tax=Cedecea sp. NFIX57 TaxID=1566286 RepID=UPI000A0B96E7|nr:DUF2857 domain-containing protein [Cedecea sp. NFIX57]SMG55515.1 Protein of unknown function [Cedecea sp. NFIX57]
MNNNHIAQATNGLLTQLVLDLKSGYLRRCESLGLDTQQMQVLLSLTLEDLHYLTNSQVPVMSFQIDYEILTRIQQQARLEQKRLESIDRALVLGGSIELMQHYFGLSSAEVAARRRIAGIDVRSGRGNVLSDEDNAQVWLNWQKAGVADADTTDGLDVMMLTAEQMDVSLTAVWHAVHSWHKLQPASVRAARKMA